jgi:hypothetical protein
VSIIINHRASSSLAKAILHDSPISGTFYDILTHTK